MVVYFVILLLLFIFHKTMDKKNNKSKKPNNKDNLLWDFKIQWNLLIWPKWQVVIPKVVRDILWVKPWDTLIWITKCDKWFLLIKADSLLEFMDFVKSEIGNNI